MPKLWSNQVNLVSEYVDCPNDIALIICSFAITLPTTLKNKKDLCEMWYHWSVGLLSKTPVSLPRQLEVEYIAQRSTGATFYPCVYVTGKVTALSDLGDLEITTERPFTMSSRGYRETILAGQKIQFKLFSSQFKLFSDLIADDVWWLPRTTPRGIRSFDTRPLTRVLSSVDKSNLLRQIEFVGRPPIEEPPRQVDFVDQAPIEETTTHDI